MASRRADSCVDFSRAFPDEISSLPGGSHSTVSSLPPLPLTNGHTDHIASPVGPTLQLISSPSNRSTISDFSSGYVLPSLRLGPTPSPVDMSSLRQLPSLPVSAGSSPDPISTSRSSARSSLVSPNGVPSLGSRALSTVGSFSGQSGRSQVISEGTVGEDVIAVSGGKKEKEKGLRRLGSLMRRKDR